MEVAEGKSIDISSGKPVIVDTPGEGPKHETTTAEPPKEEPKKEEPEPAKEEPKSEAPKEEPKKEEPKKEEPVKEFDVNAYLKEKHGIESEEDLSKILEYNQSVKEELEAEKKKEPVYKTDKEKKIAEFLKGYNVDRLGDGLETATTLIGLDPDNIDERKALEEAYILNNTELTREEAKKLYAREYRKKYEVKEEDFEDKAEFEEEKAINEIQKKKDVAQARKLLHAKKDELKFKEPEKKEEAPKAPEISKETIGGYSSQIHKVFDDGKGKKFDRIEYPLDEKDPTLKVTATFTPEQLKQLKDFSVDYLRDAKLYDENKKIPNFEPAAHVRLVANALFGDQIQDQLVKAAFTLGKTLRVEQLAGLKPDKESKGKGKDGIPSVLEQFESIGLKEKEKREKARR